MRGAKLIVAVVSVLLVLAVAGGAVWYLSTPHTAEAQFQYAEKLEKVVRGDALTKSVKELSPAIERVADEYRKVGAKYGKSKFAAEGLKRIAALQERVGQDDEKAIAALEQLIKDYTEDDNAGFALIEEARLIRKAAEALKTAKPEEAEKKYKEAIAKLEEYRKRFEKGSQGDAALMEIGRIYQDGLGDPMIRAIESFEKLLKDYPASDYRAEAMYKLGQLYEYAKEFDRAMMIYSQLLDEFPKSVWADKALFARGKLLAEKMDKPKDAAQDFQKLQEEFPQSPLREAAGGEEKSAKRNEAKKEGEEYGKSRYGGSLPYDTLRDKPVPPSAMFREFKAQKLDAQKYDLNVDINPVDHRLTVTGTLDLVNRGEDKKKMLLMLGHELQVSELKVGGVAAKVDHRGETLEIELPAELKKDAAATVQFAYTGQYCEPIPNMEDLMPKKPEKGTATAPATGPATEPAKKALPKFPYNPQLGIGDYGFGLSGASWYPVTIIGDIFDAKITIHMPPHFEAVANGAIDKSQRSDKDGVPGEFVFHTENPVFGLYFAYGDYKVQESTVGGVKYYTYFRAENAGKHDDYVKVASNILGLYSERFAPFPYEKLAIVEVPLPPMLGGVGPASLMFLHERLVAPKEVPENLLAHELAHQWFGNLIPINMMDDNYNQWLSEGFATYCDALYTEKTEGAKAMAKHMQKYGQLYFQFAMMMPPGKGSIKMTFMNSPFYRAVVYEKGATVLHMLRKVMGDEKFFRMMQQYVAAYRNKPTTVDDFRRLASAVHGEDLSWFFAQWIDQTVYAHWAIDDVQITGGEKAGDPVKTHLEVMQPDDLIKMPVDITFIGAGGERQVAANQMIDKKEQSFDVTMPFKPVKIVLDENFWVLRHPGSGNIWPAESAGVPGP